ncbi:MAG: minichromosome maintenance protein MCM [Candidatus Hadarchaeota archaeon]
MEQKLIERLEDYLHRREISKELKKVMASGHKSLVVEFKDLVEFDEKLAKVLLDSPMEFLDKADSTLSGITKIPDVRFRVKGLDKTVEIRHIRANHVGKFIQVEGVLKSAGEVKPEVKVAVFKCRRCKEEIPIEQFGEFLIEPPLCPNPNCGSKGRFDLVVENTIFRDWQNIKMQEHPSKLRGGRMPRTLNGVIRDDFVDMAVPGNHVVITGMLRVLQVKAIKEGKTVFPTVLFVNHIDLPHKGVEEAELTAEDEEKIKELMKDPWIANKIVKSISPAMRGHDEIKEAVALQLFGCNPVILQDQTRIRGDTHILLIGDPGTAKSQLLRWVSNIAPRGIYTSGMKATGAGLTAAAVRDELGGGWALEAGALVIADGGLASIDEFEKMKEEDAAALLESLESQTISIAKAGIVATLNTRTAVLAASNPRFGRFDENRTVPEQLDPNLNPVLLSRFDLIFIMKDRPTTDEDRSMAQHVIQLHSKQKLAKPPFEPEFLRKIVIYARKNIEPKMEEKEVLKRIEDFFVEWRTAAAQQNLPLPITVRQLEAIIRLAKSSARLRLRDKVDIEDVTHAINLVKVSLNQAGIDPEKKAVDVNLIYTGMTASQRERVLQVLDLIRQMEGEYGGPVPIDKVKSRAVEAGLTEHFVETLIQKEINRGTLYSPTSETVALVVK